jgi:DNA (cytosine-5)-methyltransferase 1
VFVVGCLGDWRSAAEVLFESKSLQRNIKPSREKRKEITSNSGIGVEITGPLAARRFAETDGLSEISAQMIAVPTIANCLQTTSNDYSRADGFNMICTEITGPLTARDYKGISGDDCNPTMAKMVAYQNQPISFDLAQITSKQNGTRVEPNLPVSTLAKGSQMHCAYSLQGAGATSQNANGDGYKEEQSYTLNRTDIHGVAHAFKVRGGCEGGGKGYLGQDEKAFTISTTQDQQILNQMAVRRLTPIECERLQGFPDNYTNIKDNCPDGPRYKALGNSMAVPVMKWIGERINDKS